MSPLNEMAPQDNVCYLLDKMPAEVRNHIFALGLAGATVYALHNLPYRNVLQNVCKQLFQEATDLEVEFNHILVDSTLFGRFSPNVGQDWVLLAAAHCHRIGILKTQSMQRIVIDLGRSDPTVGPYDFFWPSLQHLMSCFHKDATYKIQMHIRHPGSGADLSLLFDYGDTEMAIAQFQGMHAHVMGDPNAAFWPPHANAVYDVAARDMWRVIISMPSLQ